MTEHRIRGQINLALSILNNADLLGLEQAITEARLALEGASITDILELRTLAAVSE